MRILSIARLRSSSSFSSSFSCTGSLSRNLFIALLLAICVSPSRPRRKALNEMRWFSRQSMMGAVPSDTRELLRLLEVKPSDEPSDVPRDCERLWPLLSWCLSMLLCADFSCADFSCVDLSCGYDSPEEDRTVETEEIEASSAKVEVERVEELAPLDLRGSGGRTFPGISARIYGGG